MRLFLRKWQIAYREKKTATILTDRKTVFKAVPNGHGFAAADPFLFEKDGKTFLFAELYDKKEGLGKIGYSVFDGRSFSEWTVVISEKWHLSYPNIFEYNGDIYIVPEANESNTLYAYRAVEFPGRWEKCEPFVQGRRFTDTTFLSTDDSRYAFTYEIGLSGRDSLLRFNIDENGNIDTGTELNVSDNDGSARPGGRFFYDSDGSLIRTSQDCADDYGSGLVFSRVKDCTPESYDEEVILKIHPGDIRINRHFISGIHTYNATDSIEAVDFHTIDFDPMTQVRRILEKMGMRK